MRATYITGFPFVIAHLIYHLIEAIKLKTSTGVFWSVKDSVYFNHDGTFDWILLKITLVRSVLALFFLTNTVLIFLTAYKAGVNSSLIVSLFSANVIVAAIVFYCIF